MGITLGNDLAQVYASLDGPHCRYLLTDAAPVAGDRPFLVENPDWDRDAQKQRVSSLRIPSAALSGPGIRPDSGSRESKAGQTSGLRLHYLRMLRSAWAERRARNLPQAVRSYWDTYREPRMIDGNGIAMHLDPAPPEIERTYDLLFRLLTAYRQLCERHGIRFVLAIHAQRYQIQPRDLEATLATYALRPSSFDLMQPNRRIAAFCQRAGIPCLDPTEAMAAAHARGGQQMFMPLGDMHWNATGAEAFFEGIRDELGREVERVAN